MIMMLGDKYINFLFALIMGRSAFGQIDYVFNDIWKDEKAVRVYAGLVIEHFNFQNFMKIHATTGHKFR
jgi:hypothetical protein